MVFQSPMITARKVPARSRLATLPRHFGRHAVRFEGTVFSMLRFLSPDYEGGFWEFYELSNGGFFMALDQKERFQVTVPGNGFSGHLNGHSAGIVACLMTYSSLSFHLSSMGEQYHRLRAYALTHQDAELIMTAID